jgi:hypothetical protein
MVFKERDIYKKTVSADIFNEKSVCDILGISSDRIIHIVNFDPADAIKITIIRERVSGDIGESDIYGAQQHGTLMDFVYEM